MDNFENLSQEELLQAAQEAYEKELAASPAPAHETNQEFPEIPPVAEDTAASPCQDSLPQVEEEQPEKDEQAQDQAEPSALPTSISTTFTALGIALGLVVGGVAGFLLDMVPACLTLGVLLGVLLGLLLDVKKDKKANATPETQEAASPLLTEQEEIEHE